MDNQLKDEKGSNKKIALILGGVAIVWYVAAIFTIWQQ
jgi:hypothetical protein